MKKKSVIIVAAAVAYLECVMIFYRSNINNKEKKESAQIAIDNGELLVSSREGYNSITIYKKENSLVIYAESDAGFFDGAQFTVETQGKVEPEDVEVTWTTIGGGTEKTENNDLVIAEIKISEEDNLIFDTKVNFAKKAFDAIEEVLEKQMK